MRCVILALLWASLFASTAMGQGQQQWRFSSSTSIRTQLNKDIELPDSDDSHLVKLLFSNITADRDFTIDLNDGARTLTITADTTLSGGTHSGTNTGDQTITLTGEVTGSGTGSFATLIASDAVTYNKMQDTSSNDVVLGRASAGGGTIEEITCTTFARTLLDDADAGTARTTLGISDGFLVNDSDDTTTGTLTAAGYIGNLYDASGAVDLDIGSADVTDVTVVSDGGTIVLDGDITQDAGTTLFMGGLLDATGAVDMDYGSADITDHTFTSDGTGTVVLDGTGSTINGNAIADASDNLSFFAATTSAQLFGVLSDELGAGGSVLSGDQAVSTTDDVTFDDLSIDLLSFTDAVELTISGGVVTATNSYHDVDTQNDDPTDDLDTISGGAAGDLLWLRAESGARTVVVKDATGNIQLDGDVTLDDAHDTVALLFDGTNWLQVGGSAQGGSGAPTNAQYVVLATDATLTDERVLTGTANQITVTDSGAGLNVTLSTPQDIDTTSAVTFGSLALTTGGSTFTFHNTTDNASNEVGILKANNRITAADGDEGYISLQMADSTTAQAEFARLTWEANDVTNTTKDGEFRFDVMVNNVLTNQLTINETGTDAVTLLEGGNAVPNVTDNLSVFAATTSAQLAGVLSDETGTGVAVFGTAPTFTTSITSTLVIADTIDTTGAADIDIGSADVTDVTITTDGTGTVVLDGTSSTINGNAIADASDNLSFFAATTSAQLAGVISDETGTGVLVLGTAPTFTTTIDLSDGDINNVGIIKLDRIEPDTASTAIEIDSNTDEVLTLDNGTNTVSLSLSGDRAFHDTDADGTKDSGEEFIDQAGSWVLIESQSASNDATIVFTSGIDSTYATYIVVIESAVPATDDQSFRMRTSTDGGSTYDSGATDYVRARMQLDETSSSVGVSTATGSNQWVLTDKVGSASGEGMSSWVWLHDPSNSTQRTLFSARSTLIDAGGLLGFVDGGGFRDSAADVDAIQFFFGSGNITSGRFTLYGIKHQGFNAWILVILFGIHIGEVVRRRKRRCVQSLQSRFLQAA